MASGREGNNAVRHAAFFRSRVLKDLRGAAGFRRAQLLQGKTGGRAHITVITPESRWVAIISVGPPFKPCMPISSARLTRSLSGGGIAPCRVRAGLFAAYVRSAFRFQHAPWPEHSPTDESLAV